ncbi:hypothetical protein [Microbacterium gorillae]|uniref:hypothetical protein n=1 Tax=Microbacterium gorillae TaxID=1231063 RepID=UPI003D993DA9
MTTVIATLKAGLENVALADGAQTTWTFDMSFVPVLEAPADWSFSYYVFDDLGSGYLFDPVVADFLADHATSMTLITNAVEASDYGVFDSSGNQLIEFNALGVASNITETYDVQQTGQTFDFTRTNVETSGGQAAAEYLFGLQGPLPDGATVQAIPGTWRWISYSGTIEAIYNNGCALATTIGTGLMVG